MLIRHFGRNKFGRDIAIGDIHGCWDRVERGLEEIGFDKQYDRLFSVGDLVDRGPQSSQSLWWLSQPWFFAVRGNHDQYVVDWRQRPVDKWVSEGGSWFQNFKEEHKDEWAAAFGKLPIGMEIETEEGLVCIVHADVMFDTWETFKEYLHSKDHRIAWLVRNAVQGSRNRYQIRDERPVRDIRALVVGHCKVAEPLIVANIHHIDTEGWKKGYFTFYDLATLEPIRAQA